MSCLPVPRGAHLSLIYVMIYVVFNIFIVLRSIYIFPPLSPVSLLWSSELQLYLSNRRYLRASRRESKPPTHPPRTARSSHESLLPLARQPSSLMMNSDPPIFSHHHCVTVPFKPTDNLSRITDQHSSIDRRPQPRPS